MASKEQREIMEQWQNHTGFEFMSQEEARASDPQGFLDLWAENIQWLEVMATDSDTIINEYRNRHG